MFCIISMDCLLFLHNIEFQHPAIAASDSIQCIHTVTSWSSRTQFSFWYLEVEVGKIFKIDKMSKPISRHEELNAEYKERIPVLPEDIDNKMTNLLLAAQVTRLPLKVSQFEKHVLLNIQNFSLQYTVTWVLLIRSSVCSLCIIYIQ